MVLRVTVGKSVLNIVSVYAPKVGRFTERGEGGILWCVGKSLE